MKVEELLEHINKTNKHNNSDGLYDYMKREIERLNNNIKEAIKLLDIYFSNGINVQEPKDKIKKVLKKGDKE